MPTELHQWSDTSLMLIFIVVALVIPGIFMYFDDDEQHHLH